MRATGKAGRVYGPVGQSRTLLCVGGFGAWSAEVEPQVYTVDRLGGMQARAAMPATVKGEAEGWEAHSFFWPALAEPVFEIELDEAGALWRFPAEVGISGSKVTFRATGQAYIR